jgi:putative transposase
MYPTKAQATILWRMLEECRWVYNKTLETRKHAYEQEGNALGYYETATMLPAWKQDRPSLKIVHSQVLQNAQIRNAAINILALGLQRMGSIPRSLRLSP